MPEVQRFTAVSFSFEGQKWEAAVDESSINDSADGAVFRTVEDAEWHHAGYFWPVLNSEFKNKLRKHTEELAPVDINDEANLDFIHLG